MDPPLVLQQPARKGRRGTSIVEIVVTIVLLNTLFVTLAPLAAWVHRERRDAWERQLALQELANQLETLSLQLGNDIGAESLAAVAPSENAIRALPYANLKVILADKDALEGRRITLELRWKDRTGIFVAPVRLTAWMYPRQETSE